MRSVRTFRSVAKEDLCVKVISEPRVKKQSERLLSCVSREFHLEGTSMTNRMRWSVFVVSEFWEKVRVVSSNQVRRTFTGK